MSRLFVCIICFNFILFSKPINNQKAIETAEKFLSAKSLQNKVIKSIDTYKKNNLDILYIINFDPDGFILLSGDDRITPVLAYSYDNKFRVNNTPQSINWLLEMYANSIINQINNSETQILSIKENWDNFEDEQSFYRSRDVTPLLEAQFNQAPEGWWDFLDIFDWIDWDWNAECPEDDDGPGGHVVVGCVAVAMSQVMHYWQHPVYGESSHTYDSGNYGELSINYGDTYYEFEHMDATESDYQNQTLLYHAGVAVEMNYSPYGSGAYTCGDNRASIETALPNYFRYDDGINCIHAYNYDEGDEISFEDELISELDDSRPLVFRASNDLGPGGHAWNIDGYQTQNDGTIRFHCNWGWGSEYNGYFALNNLSPGDHQFGEGQAALIGIKPEAGCVDEAAFNYNPDPAIVPCESCCDYCLDGGIIDISIVPDEYPEDITWELWYKGIYVYSYQYLYPTLIESGDIEGEQLCIRDEGMYEFIIYDENGDGLCCTSSDEGSYQVDLNGSTVAEGAVFGSSESTLFVWPDSDGDLVNDSMDECEGFDDNIDSDSDGLADGCDACPNDANNDEDGDGSCYGEDICPFDYYNDIDDDNICGDVDNCPELANESQSNFDGDTQGDICDLDDDNDGFPDPNDTNPYNIYECSDDDLDTCDECSSGVYSDTFNDGWDYDADGLCDAGDDDDDNDGITDFLDSDDNNEFVCTDLDLDTCDDCAYGIYDTINDGPDYDGDGMCDLGDTDDDNDGCPDNIDDNPFEWNYDYDADGIPDDCDADDDNDGVLDVDDCHPLDSSFSEFDCCGVCGGDGSSCSGCSDCGGVPDGPNYYDNCGICDDNPDNDCIQDCTGDWGGSAVLDDCGVCNGNNDCQLIGDINDDGYINVTDIVIIVTMILSNQNDYNAFADMNGDGAVNVVDIVVIIELILNN